jgi:polyhydroxyalkanoate synthesis regulator phasin
MNNGIVEIFEGQQITIRPSDGYWNATEMCKRYGRKVNDFARLKGSKDYLEALSSVTGIPVTELVQQIQGGTPELQGTWVSSRVALKLAAWLNPYFEVWVYSVIERLLTQGKVELQEAYDTLLEALDISETQVQELLTRSNRLDRELSGLLDEYNRDDYARASEESAWLEVKRLTAENERLRERLRELGEKL